MGIMGAVKSLTQGDISGIISNILGGNPLHYHTHKAQENKKTSKPKSGVVKKTRRK